MHKRKQIKQFLVQAVKQAVPEFENRVDADRFIPRTEDEMPCAGVYIPEDRAVVFDHVTLRHSVVVSVEVHSSGDAFSETEDDFCTAIEAKLLQDPTLGGIGQDFDFESFNLMVDPMNEKQSASCMLKFVFTYDSPRHVGIPANNFATSDQSLKPMPSTLEADRIKDLVSLPE